MIKTHKERCFRDGSKKQIFLEGYAEVGISYDTKNGVRAIGYSSKRSKPDFHYVFRSDAAAAAHIEKWVTELKATQKRNQDEKEAKKNFTHDFKMGDILYSTLAITPRAQADLSSIPSHFA